jgi:hypothetical protein
MSLWNVDAAHGLIVPKLGAPSHSTHIAVRRLELLGRDPDYSATPPNRH